MPRPNPEELANFTLSEREHILRVRWNPTLEENEFISLQTAVRRSAAFANQIQDELELRANEPVGVTLAHFAKVRTWFALGQYTPTAVRRGTGRRRRSPRIPFDSEIERIALHMENLTLAPAFAYTPTGRGGVGARPSLVWSVRSASGGFHYSLPFRIMVTGDAVRNAESLQRERSELTTRQRELHAAYIAALGSTEQQRISTEQQRISTEYTAVAQRLDAIRYELLRPLRTPARATFVP